MRTKPSDRATIRDNGETRGERGGREGEREGDRTPFCACPVRSTATVTPGRARRARGPEGTGFREKALGAMGYDGRLGLGWRRKRARRRHRPNVSSNVATSYDIFNRKLFSLPKLILLPAIVSRQPMLLLKIFPFIFVTDVIKGRIVASVTDKVEQFTNEARDIKSIRQKVEQFDMKNAELVSGFTRTRDDMLWLWAVFLVMTRLGKRRVDSGIRYQLSPP